MDLPAGEYITVKIDVDYNIPEIVKVEVRTEHSDTVTKFEHLKIADEPIADIPYEFWQYNLQIVGEGQVLIKRMDAISPKDAPPAPMIKTTFAVEVNRDLCRYDLCNQFNVNAGLTDYPGLCYNMDPDHYEPSYTGAAKPKGYPSPGSGDFLGLCSVTFNDDKEKAARAACNACPFNAIKVTQK